jgi:tRNA modification GTPase
VREASDSIESIGIDRTNQAMADADVILLVIDGSVPVTGEDLKLWRRLGERRHIVVVNKCDLPSANSIEPEQAFQGADVVRVSALYGEGLEVLSNVIASLVDVGNANIDGVLVTDSRHYDLLCHARDELGNALGSLRANEGEELVLTGLYNALKFLGAITGETTTEEILSEIFATFCIGK